MSRQNVPGTIYVIHFSTPYKHAANYLGWTEDLETHPDLERRPAPGKATEKPGQLQAARPECGVKPRKDTTMQTTLTSKATPQEAAELQDTLERGYQRAYEAAREADPWGSEYEARFQTAAECNEVAADAVHETLENGMRRPAESTADFLSRARAEAQAAEAKPAGFQTADQLIRVQADAGMTPDAIDRHQEQIAAGLLTDAKTAEGQAFAREYADTAATHMRDLKELDQPSLTPGAPHPAQALAAKGWHVCDHGIYTSHSDGPLQAEPEAC